ncbi:hypothetical protein CANCADRAFT_111251 [Tortispora caseinolytica NRRL Y-17796]|uniref:60S ribosomal export protein NMD3 n=1 Tax=Tortispora caseinolytica NRRL Y-17796 TaxID=767744 RepID=A0A1E4TGC9_9ASCO|nr:hypothetical protein CANCADRAFT_111251 [Tortispora caseinolytica NRRL Y-17796]
MENMQQFVPNTTVATILCCNCGVPMDGSSGIAMCNDCIMLTSDITSSIQRESNLHFCRNCERYLQPPSHWVTAKLESRELLALCLRKLRGMGKVRLVDANFLWTEPHSRRIRVKVTVQGETSQGAILQQSFEVEYVVLPTQCPDCARSFTVNTWRASIQIRQKVPHKRTFLYLEQLILKHNAHQDTISIKESKDGLDFYYSSQQHALKMIDFLAQVAPIRSKRAEELISEDTHTGNKNYKFSFSVEIVPICKDDLVVLPLKTARQLGNISQLTICSKISNTVRVIDPISLQIADVSTNVYWRTPFVSLCDATSLVEFMVLDIELTGPTNGKYALAEATVARTVDLGRNDDTYFVRTHLGNLLHSGDLALGYFLTNTNFNHDLFDSLDQSRVPDVVLVKKHYPRRRHNRNRTWKLQRMAKEHNDADNSAKSKKDHDQVEQDYEMFLQELEEDAELRNTVNLYKRKDEAMPSVVDAHPEEDDDMDDSASLPEIDVNELLDELDDMHIAE